MIGLDMGTPLLKHIIWCGAIQIFAFLNYSRLFDIWSIKFTVKYLLYLHKFVSISGEIIRHYIINIIILITLKKNTQNIKGILVLLSQIRIWKHIALQHVFICNMQLFCFRKCYFLATNCWYKLSNSSLSISLEL